MTIIATPPLLLDSAGQPVNGFLVGYQTTRFNTTAGLVTQSSFRATVSEGLITLDGEPLDVPPTPDGHALVLVELFESLDNAGRKIIVPSPAHHVVVPDQVSIAYSDLLGVVASPTDGLWQLPPYVMGFVRVLTGAEPRPAVPFCLWIGGDEKPANIIEGDVWLSTVPVVVNPDDPGEPPAGVAPTITATTLATMTQNEATTQNLTVTGTSPIMWTVSAGTLPAGLNLSSTGILSGTPTVSGAYSFTASATNATGTDTQVFAGTIAAAPVAPSGRSVFGTGTGGLTFTANNDGGTLRVVNGFYVYGSGVDNAVVAGMRIYVPAGMDIPPSGTGYIYSPVTGTPPAAQLGGLTPQTVVLTGLVAGQWNDLLFTTPVATTPGLPVYVGYEFGNGAYIASGTVPTTPIASSPAGLALIANPDMVGGAPWDRSLYRPNGGAWGTSPAGPSYGIDIIVTGA